MKLSIFLNHPEVTYYQGLVEIEDENGVAHRLVWGDNGTQLINTEIAPPQVILFSRHKDGMGVKEIEGRTHEQWNRLDTSFYSIAKRRARRDIE